MAQTTTAGGDTSTTTNMGMTASSATTSDSSGSSDPSWSFISEIDGGMPECDTFAQDCPAGEKCTLWSEYGGGSWTGTRCVPVVPDPRLPGEECSIDGDTATLSGRDDCALGSICWFADGTHTTCVEFCIGGEANPRCADPCMACTFTGAGIFYLCLPYCDPLLQNCAESEGCYAYNNGFFCAPDASGDDGQLGDTCDSINTCDPGYVCADAELVPGCDGTGCCTPLCDASGTDSCDAVLRGTSCGLVFEAGARPGCGGASVGACTLP